jgi:hypothetical protein
MNSKEDLFTANKGGLANLAFCGSLLTIMFSFGQIIQNNFDDIKEDNNALDISNPLILFSIGCATLVLSFYAKSKLDNLAQNESEESRKNKYRGR